MKDFFAFANSLCSYIIYVENYQIQFVVEMRLSLYRLLYWKRHLGIHTIAAKKNQCSQDKFIKTHHYVNGNENSGIIIYIIR